jgi:hypothetical protein
VETIYALSASEILKSPDEKNIFLDYLMEQASIHPQEMQEKVKNLCSLNERKIGELRDMIQLLN